MTEVLLHNPTEITNPTLPLFDEVYRRHFPDVVGYLYWRSGNYMLAEDLAQQIFIKLLYNHTNINGEIVNIRESDKIAAFLRRVASRILIDHKRTKRNAPTEDIEGFEMPERVSTDPAKLAIIREGVQERNSMVRILKVGIRTLDPKHRQVLRESFDEERSDPAIAEILGVPLGTVKSRKSRGRKELIGRVFPRGISAYNLPDSLREVGDYPF